MKHPAAVVSLFALAPYQVILGGRPYNAPSLDEVSTGNAKMGRLWWQASAQ